MAQPDLNLSASALATPHGVYSGLDRGGPREHPAVAAGWRRFAATMILIAAAGNLLWGIAAVTSDRHFRAHDIVAGSLGAWGGIVLAVAALQILTAVLILRRSRTGVVLGIAIAGLGMLAQLVAIGAYPVWSVFVIVIDGLVIYGLAVHGDSD
jgi:hypothetical protein